METHKCPFCGEKILKDARKCKHCKEWIVENPNLSEEGQSTKDDESSSGIPNYIMSPILIGIGWAILHFGGWIFISGSFEKIINKLDLSIAWVYEEWGWLLPDTIVGILTADIPNFLLGGHSLLIRINDSYYGLVITSRYFDSPIIQWIMLGIGVSIISSALFSLIFEFNKKI